MSRPENPTIATLDDANAAQQLIRAAARRLIERWDAKDLEIIIRATERTQGYLKELRALEHAMKVARHEG
jgi:hypothetical protein